MRPDALEPLETHAEWRAADVADPERWIVRLDDEDLAELDEALRISHERVGDVLDVTVEDFPLPRLAPKIDAIGRELVDGRGFVLIRGIPVDRYSDADASRIYWGIGMHLGRPWPQNKHGHLLGDVTDQGKSAYDPTSRGNEIGGVAFPYHSDGSDLVGLLCLRKAKSGGTSTVANAVAVHNEMVRRAPELAAELYDPLPYDFRGEEPKNGRPFYAFPVFTRHEERLFVRYIRPYIESSQRHEDAPRLSPKAREAMDLVDRLTEDPELNVYMDFEPGDIQLINNYHVLHARTAYEDWPEPGRKRFLKRLWLETPRLASRPPYFEMKNFARHWAERGRTKAS